MRLSSYLTNREVFWACVCGACLAPALYVIIIALHIVAEWVAG